MMLFDPEFWDRRLAGRGMVPLSRPGDPKRKPALSTSSTRSRIVIPLTSKPADYVPGSGPPLQPISLLPPGDSTAYIIERVLLPSPGLAPNGRPLPKRMAYLIGWRDLPAASKVVPAMQVLDYVSPRTLEDFEARLEQELDDEKSRLEAELKSDLVAPQAKKKRRRGRPPAHSQIETAVVAEPETVAQAKSRHKKGVMSLTTPKKPRLEEFEWLSDEQGSPSRQIAQEQFQSEHGFLPTEDDMSGGSESPPPNGPSASMPNGAQADSIRAKFGQPSAAPIQPSSFTRSESSAESSSGSQTPANSSPMPTSSVQRDGQGQQPLSFPSATRSETLYPENVPASEAGTTEESTQATAKPKNSKKRPRPEEDSPPAQAEGETDWVVERIEDVEYYEVEGRGVVRYFKVSWEGDWPPDQKKTWEPEENIPPNLVRNFFKTSRNKRKSMAKSGPGKQSRDVKHTQPKNGVSKQQSSHKQGPVMKQSRLSWPGVRRKYSSVSEAFAGDQDNLEMVDEAYDGEENGLNGNGQDEFFVVTEGGEGEVPSQSQSLWPSAGAFSTAFGVYQGFP
ncbi:hypothetical protein CCMA1212_007784 [Trichoderma ghanense]|uniref:Chromo domain-containing protein n=1 Tax=Trichoderma ghanense TaxID=65468 RepID=A0ABY2GZK3_9HYPO